MQITLCLCNAEAKGSILHYKSNGKSFQSTDIQVKELQKTTVMPKKMKKIIIKKTNLAIGFYYSNYYYYEFITLF